MLKPSIRIADLSIAKVPVKQADQHYRTTEWRDRRLRIFKRDSFKCVIPGCGQAAKVCEHVVSRRNGGGDDDSNLVALCRDHDNRFKENPDGTRKNFDEWLKIFAKGRG